MHLYRTGIYGYGYIHGYPRKICGYGYGYGWEISYPRQPWVSTVSLLHLQAYLKSVYRQVRAHRLVHRIIVSSIRHPRSSEYTTGLRWRLQAGPPR